MNAQVGAITRGTYTMRIVDPILLVKNFVPVGYLRPDSEVFDFADMDNPAGEQLFNEVVGSLSAAFSNYTNDPSKGNRITKIQGLALRRLCLLRWRKDTNGNQTGVLKL